MYDEQQQERGTLAAIFAQEQEQLGLPAKKRGPAVYRSYMGGRCQNPACGEPLGHIETEGGRDRHYCNDKCRVAAHRARKREEQRAAILQYHGELREYWQLHGLKGEVLLRLQEILLQHGQKAARAATDAVIVALAAQEQTGSQEQACLIDEIMQAGEAASYPAIHLEGFRIPAGVESWAEFVSNACNSNLREVRYHLYYERQQRADARARLRALGGDQ